jgi:transposase
LKSLYEKEFESLVRGNKQLRALKSIPGIGVIGAVKIAACVVDPGRFEDKGHFWSYCGLVKHKKMSGGKCYGCRDPRCCRMLKSVFKTAAMAGISGGANNTMRIYYEHLIRDKRMETHNARNKVARKIANIALSIMESGKHFDARRFGKCKESGS